MTLEADPQSCSKSEAQLWHSLTASAASSLGSRVVTHPVDTLKARLQVEGHVGSVRRTSVFDAAKQVARREGLLGFYRGFGAIVVGAMPANSLYFGGYEAGKRLLGRSADNLACQAAVGVIAQLAASIIYTPVDLIKERLQVQSAMGSSFAKNKGSFTAAASILHSQAGVAGLMKGFFVTNAVWIPWNILYVPAYEQTRMAMRRVVECPIGDPLPAWATAVSSGSASALAATLTHPLDVVKTRLQVLSAQPGAANITALDVAARLFRREGVHGFTRGLSARLLTLAPGNALSWTLYETVKAWLHRS